MFLKKIPLLFFVILCGNLVIAQKYISKEMPEVTNQWNGNTFTSTKTFSENIAEAPEFTILSKILKEESLTGAIEKNEMVTIFAVTDNAFNKMDRKEKDSILGNKKLMVSMIRFLIVPGRIDTHGLKTEAKNHNGKFSLATLHNQNLEVTEREGRIYLTDSEGREAGILEGDFYHKNGFFHIVDGVVLPDQID